MVSFLVLSVMLTCQEMLQNIGFYLLAVGKEHAKVGAYER
jgi:hypothetical protein